MDVDTRAAFHAIHFDPPHSIKRDQHKHSNDFEASLNLRFIVETLIECFDKKKPPPASLLFSLRGLSEVATLLEEAASYPKMRDESEEHPYRKKKKQAKNALLRCFGLGPTKGRPKLDHEELITRMAELLCPPVNEDFEPDGEPTCSTKEQAANRVAEDLDGKVTPKTIKNAWKEWAEVFTD